MNANEFFYWLQGFFELTDDPTAALSAVQAECITKHIALVERPPERLIEIRALLRIGARAAAAGGVATNAAAVTDAIRGLVSEQFVHVIDPAAGGPEVQTKLNKAHGGKMRC